MRAKPVGPTRKHGVGDHEWNPITNPAVQQLLDHLAEELAREYLHLMKQASERTGDVDPGNGQQKG